MRRSNSKGGGQETRRRSRGDGGGQEAAAAVWAAVSGMTIGEAWLRRDAPKSPELVAKYRDAMGQLERGVPFPYAVGRVGFRTLDLAIDRRALIPRPETEGLVDLVLANTRNRVPNTGGRVADIGTGCGCIALALAVEGRFEKVVAVEQSPAAAALARENVEHVGPKTPVEIREGNLLAPLVDKGERELYRAIVSNPPYLSAADYAALDRSVADYEPRDALVSGLDGLDATRALFAGAAALLEPGGLLALEIDERRADAVHSVGRTFGWGVEVYDDVFGRPRYALSIKEE
ncbi:MAG TPA: peptide chain release factor N(5)-glutamine methyltransferase [Gemmatimonadales bacterium]|jgi:release factor glutamine methyltransferase